MMTRDLSNLTPSVLALIGISAVTGLSSAAVDLNKLSEKKTKIQSLENKKKEDEAEVEKLQSEIEALNKSINATPAPINKDEKIATLAVKQAGLVSKEKEIKQENQKIQKLTSTVKIHPTKNFFRDILSDEHGVSFYRFQMFAWTIVLICIFVSQVYNYLTMPDFDSTLLALMGISGGTYVGFKIPKQQD
jgi:hypothetical protein